MSNKKSIVDGLTILLSMGAAFFIIKTVLYSSLKISKQFFKVNNIDSLENKLKVVLTIFYYVGMMLFIIQILVSLYRAKTGKNPVNSKQDPKIVVCLNRIIGNTIEQAFVFFPIYIYWLYIFNINKSRISEALGYPLLFLIGRVLFAIGYLLGTVVDILPLRTTGMSINIIISSFLLLQTQGINLANMILG